MFLAFSLSISNSQVNTFILLAQRESISKWKLLVGEHISYAKVNCSTTSTLTFFGHNQLGHWYINKMGCPVPLLSPYCGHHARSCLPTLLTHVVVPASRSLPSTHQGHHPSTFPPKLTTYPPASLLYAASLLLVVDPHLQHLLPPPLSVESRWAFPLCSSSSNCSHSADRGAANLEAERCIKNTGLLTNQSKSSA
jgi:hypothetical protein